MKQRWIKTQYKQRIEALWDPCGVKQHHWNYGAKEHYQLIPGVPRNRHKKFRFCFDQIYSIQYNLNGSNTDGSFTVDDSNSFFSPYKILPIAQENKYLGIFFLF